MVRVPGGLFLMGTPATSPLRRGRPTLPTFQAPTGPFSYRARRCSPRRPKMPAYARWAGKDLPTEAERIRPHITGRQVPTQRVWLVRRHRKRVGVDAAGRTETHAEPVNTTPDCCAPTREQLHGRRWLALMSSVVLPPLPARRPPGSWRP